MIKRLFAYVADMLTAEPTLCDDKECLTCAYVRAGILPERRINF